MWTMDPKHESQIEQNRTASSPSQVCFLINVFTHSYPKRLVGDGAFVLLKTACIRALKQGKNHQYYTLGISVM